MEESLTLTLSDTSSILEAQYFTSIELSTKYNYELGLVELLTFNSISNINQDNNKFYVYDKVIALPTGSYEIEDIEKYLIKALKLHNIQISIKPNNNTLRSVIKCSHQISFEPEDSIGKVLRLQSKNSRKRSN